MLEYRKVVLSMFYYITNKSHIAYVKWKSEDLSKMEVKYILGIPKSQKYYILKTSECEKPR